MQALGLVTLVVRDYDEAIGFFTDTLDFELTEDLYQTEQDNMEETPDLFYSHGSRDIPLFSLYSATREPTVKQLEGVDTIVVDLQDIGCRVYTFM